MSKKKYILREKEVGGGIIGDILFVALSIVMYSKFIYEIVNYLKLHHP